MRPQSIAAVAFAAFLCLNIVFPEYWFQFGARGGSSATQNHGAGVSIQTIVPQVLSDGSVAFWVGEDLSNGAFLQIGYLIENQSGDYPSACDTTGCHGYQHLRAGDAEWFYEYFPSPSVDTFLGTIGPDGSAGVNGSINNYTFYSNGNTWYFEFNGNALGNVTLGSGSSGDNVPIAFGEIANTTTSSQHVSPVEFKNLKFYDGKTFLPVSNGYSYIGYGIGSSSALKDPYGVLEIANKVNNFLAGSGLPQPLDNTQLWTIGYMLKIISSYGNMLNSTEYFAYSSANISAPRFVYIAPGSRGEFVQWRGTGYGAYTGAANQSTIFMGSNITEEMVMKPQYLLSISSAYANASGSGWYAANSVVSYSISSNVFYQNASSRQTFTGWSNGQKNVSAEAALVAPENITAEWQQQYLVDATSDYGNVTGYGWHNKGSTVTLSPAEPVANISATEKLAFYSWSSGLNPRTLALTVDGPISIHAQYKRQYLTYFQAVDMNNNPINATDFQIGNKTFSNSAFLFSNVSYDVQSAYYNGFKLPVNSNVSVDSSSHLVVHLPLYTVYVQTTDLFGIPVNALTRLQLQNGTQITAYTGSGGMLALQDVPYGTATGSAVFFGINESITASRGSIVHLIYLSYLDIGVFVAVIILAAVLYLVVSKTLHRRSGRNASSAAQDSQPDKKQNK